MAGRLPALDQPRGDGLRRRVLRRVPSTALNVSHIGNAALHVGWGLKHRSLDPGIVSAVTALLPVGVLGIARALRDPEADRGSIAAGAVAGLVIAAAMMPAMKLRLRRRRAAA